MANESKTIEVGDVPIDVKQNHRSFLDAVKETIEFWQGKSTLVPNEELVTYQNLMDMDIIDANRVKI